jgi:hypothetical protein
MNRPFAVPLGCPVALRARATLSEVRAHSGTVNDTDMPPFGSSA